MKNSKKAIIDNVLYRQDIKRVLSLNLPWEKLQNSKILITGAYGLIGSCLIDVLMCSDMNISVYALGRDVDKMKDRFYYYLDNSNFKYIIQDVIEPLHCNVEFDYIVHAASGANPKLYSNNPVDIMLANFLGMLNILEYAKENNCKRVYYLSSSEVYGSQEKTNVEENDQAIVSLNQFRNCYPDSKRATETLCQSYIKQYGLNIVIGRPSHIYGPMYTKEDNKVIAQFLNNALNHEDIVLKSSGIQKRSYCHVIDTVSAMLYHLLLGNNGEAYNISNNDAYIRLKDLAITISKISGVDVKFENSTDQEREGYNKTLDINISSEKTKSLGWYPIYNISDGISNVLSIRGEMYNG